MLFSNLEFLSDVYMWWDVKASRWFWDALLEQWFLGVDCIFDHYWWYQSLVPWALGPLPCWPSVSWRRFWSFSVFALLWLSLVTRKLDIFSLAWMRWCSFQNSGTTAISLIFTFKGQVQNMTNSTGWTGGDLWRCQGNYVETGFSYKTWKDEFWGTSACLALSIYLLKFTKRIILGHFATLR